jgi:hypothetical protein
VTRSRLAALAAATATAIALSGCPIPQPLPDYPPGTATPPRILVDQIQVNGALEPLTVIDVPLDCATPPTYAIDVILHDDVARGAFARWFIDYRPVQGAYEFKREDAIPPPASVTSLTEQVPTYTFSPYQPDKQAPGAVRVVELVVSANFAANPTAGPMPYRTPEAGYETQVYRWIFRLISGTEGCPP